MQAKQLMLPTIASGGSGLMPAGRCRSERPGEQDQWQRSSLLRDDQRCITKVGLAGTVCCRDSGLLQGFPAGSAVVGVGLRILQDRGRSEALNDQPGAEPDSHKAIGRAARPARGGSLLVVLA